MGNLTMNMMLTHLRIISIKLLYHSLLTPFVRLTAVSQNINLNQVTFSAKSQPYPGDWSTIYPYTWNEYVCLEMHRLGINLRYLGSLRRAMPVWNHDIRSVLLTEMVVRTLRVFLDHAMRQSVKSKKKEQPKPKCIDRSVESLLYYYTCPFNAEKSQAKVKKESSDHMSTDDLEKPTTKFWTIKRKGGIKLKLLTKYPEALTHQEEKKTFDLRQAVDMDEVRRRLPSDAPQIAHGWIQQ